MGHVPLLLGTVGNKLSFQWQLSPDVLAWPHLKKKKTISHVHFKTSINPEDPSQLQSQFTIKGGLFSPPAQGEVYGLGLSQLTHNCLRDGHRTTLKLQ